MALKLVACTLLLEITTFLREYYRSLPKPSALVVASAGRSAAGTRGTGGGSAFNFGGQQQQQASASSRRWSAATQSVAAANAMSNSGGGTGSTSGAPQPSPAPPSSAISDQAPPPPPSVTPLPGEQPRRISFVLQDDVLAVQVGLHERK